MTDSKIVPFGKHKRRPIEEVLIDDPNYLQWLSGGHISNSIREKIFFLFPQHLQRLATSIGNERTIGCRAQPDHFLDASEDVCLQVLFLDDESCVRFARALPGFDKWSAKLILIK